MATVMVTVMVTTATQADGEEEGPGLAIAGPDLVSTI
jgi:hypothetical protein